MLFATVLLGSLTACKGLYTGGGWIDSTEGDGKANFGFNVTNCEGYVEGHFNYRDKNAGIKMNGEIVEFKQCFFGDCKIFDCDYYSIVDYRSTNPKVPGYGQAWICAGDGGEGANSSELDDVWIYVIDGPYDGYFNFGSVNGNIQQHECVEEEL